MARKWNSCAIPFLSPASLIIYHKHYFYDILLYMALLSYLQNEHILKRLKIVHGIIILAAVLFFIILHVLGLQTTVGVLWPQMTLVAMGGIMAVSYLSLVGKKERIPLVPLISFFLLNILTTLLVWFTGALGSPFIPLYLMIVMVSAQLYSYVAALCQTVLAFAGLVIIFNATTNAILPLFTLFPGTVASAHFQSDAVVIIFGILYALLFLFTALSSSNARVMLYRPHARGEMDSTYQERIVNNMPIAVLIVDETLNMLRGNAYAKKHFTFKPSTTLAAALNMSQEACKHTLEELSHNGKEKKCSWKKNHDSYEPVEIRVYKDTRPKEKDSAYIVFVEEVEQK